MIYKAMFQTTTAFTDEEAGAEADPKAYESES